MTSNVAVDNVQLSGPVVVPEPSTWASLLLGGAGLLGLSLRQRRHPRGLTPPALA